MQGEDGHLQGEDGHLRGQEDEARELERKENNLLFLDAEYLHPGLWTTLRPRPFVTFLATKGLSEFPNS